MLISITDGDRSCLYELMWQADPPAIIIHVNEQLATAAEPLSRASQPVSKWAEQIEHPERFYGDFTGDRYGFGTQLIVDQCSDHYLKLTAALPSYEMRTCRCLAPYDSCRLCDGTGLQPKPNTQRLREITINLMLLFQHLHHTAAQPVHVRSRRKQLLTLETHIRRRKRDRNITAHRNHYSFFGQFSASLRYWLTRQQPGELPAVTEVMKTAHHLMYGHEHSNGSSFRAYCNGGDGIALRSPGSACGVNSEREHHGLAFYANNVDGPADQLTLLAGLAALHTQVRKAVG